MNIYTEVPDLDSEFTKKDLTLLEKEAGIPILKELKANRQSFLRKIRINIEMSLEDALEKWLTNPVTSHIEPTWKNLYYVLCLMNQDSLAEKLKSYLLRATKCPPHNLDTSDQHHEVEQRINQFEQSMDGQYYAAVCYQRKPLHSVAIYFVVVCEHHYVGLHDIVYCVLCTCM